MAMPGVDLKKRSVRCWNDFISPGPFFFFWGGGSGTSNNTLVPIGLGRLIDCLHGRKPTNYSDNLSSRKPFRKTAFREQPYIWSRLLLLTSFLYHLLVSIELLEKEMIIPIRCFSCGKVVIHLCLRFFLWHWHGVWIRSSGTCGNATYNCWMREFLMGKLLLEFKRPKWHQILMNDFKWRDGSIGLQAVLLPQNDHDPCRFDWEATSVSASLLELKGNALGLCSTVITQPRETARKPKCDWFFAPPFNWGLSPPRPSEPQGFQRQLHKIIAVRSVIPTEFRGAACLTFLLNIESFAAPEYNCPRAFKLISLVPWN